MTRGREAALRRAGAVARRMSRRIGYELVKRDFYAPVPDLDSLDRATWTEPGAMSGIDFDVDAQFDFVECHLKAFVSEFQVPRTGAAGDEFYLDNGSFESVDAELYYAMLRHLKPRTVIELGSGSSTRVASMALERNAAQGSSTDYLVFDPYPWQQTSLAPLAGVEVRPLPATEVPLEEFGRLGPGDVLFVDTTHTVKLGGDVNWIVLDVLPRLAEGVAVHFHDIFLPYEYPREWALAGRLWGEQYLLQAFLACNPSFEVLFGAHALSRSDPGRLAATVPSFRPGVAPGSFWIARGG